MYLREFTETPERFVENGKAHFGTFSSVPFKVDIHGMRSPYAGIPLPSFISKLRIKSRLNYIFSLKKYIGIAQFIDFKVVGLAEIIFWNKESGKKTVYHSFMPVRRRFIPTNTNRGICASYLKSRFIKISWGRNHQHHSLTFSVKGDSVRPKASGYIYSPMQDDMHCDVSFVNPSPASMRCSATWFSTMKVRGVLSINDEKVDDSEGLGAMVLNRTYYKMRSKTKLAFGLGTVNNKNIIFELKDSNLDASDSNSYNDNVLVVDGVPTALPSVYMTHPFGFDKNWVIQDTESMIDLTFTPINMDSKVFNVIALRTVITSMSGTFEGVILTKDGEKIVLKNFPGVIYRNQVRL